MDFALVNFGNKQILKECLVDTLIMKRVLRLSLYNLALLACDNTSFALLTFRLNKNHSSFIYLTPFADGSKDESEVCTCVYMYVSAVRIRKKKKKKKVVPPGIEPGTLSV